MDDLVERLRDWCTDWNGDRMVDGECPRDGLHCDIIREASNRIEALEQALREIVDDVDEEHMRVIARTALKEESLPHDVEQHEAKGKTATDGDREQDHGVKGK